MRNGLLLGFPCICFAAIVLLLGSPHRSAATSGAGSVAAAAVEANIAGRLIVDSSGSAQLIGYYPFIYGLPSNLFSGAASETTGYFTFRSSVFTINPLQNGNILHLLSTPSAGTTNVMSVYVNSYPNQNFSLPDTFSAGQMIAQYSTGKFIGTASAFGGVEAGTLVLMSSSNFSFQGQSFNLGALGSATTISLTFGQPISGGFSGGPAVVAFGGSAIGVGNSFSPSPGRVR
jgi:hypothetical protein